MKKRNFLTTASVITTVTLAILGATVSFVWDKLISSWWKRKDK